VSATSIWHPARWRRPPARPAVAVPVRPRRGRRWVGTVIGLGLVAGATWGVTHSSIFGLRTLRVTGNVRLSQSDVAAIAGLDGRTNVLWLSTNTVERRLEASAWIQHARISRTLPSVVTVSITERTAAAVLDGSGLLVSSDGGVLGPAPAHASLPLIDGRLQGRGMTARLPVDLPALVVLRSISPDLVALIGRVGIDRGGALILSMRDGTRVVFGTPDEAAAKGSALQALLRWTERKGVDTKYIDVTVPTAPAIRPAGETGPG
jgi:cell division septal protein FtsQ